jgi:acyl-CoA synthetase (NDP forming)
MLNDGAFVLKEIFEANSLAVIGASPNPNKITYTLIESIKDHGFRGEVYPVNPKYKEILGFRCYPSLSSIENAVELVFYALPANSVLNAIMECANKKVKALVIIASGFSEASEAGADLEARIAAEAKKTGLRILGPNTTGFVCASRSLVASINHFDTWLGGNLAIAGQTGIFCGAYMDEVMSRSHQRLGYEFSISLGNKMDFEEADFVNYAGRFPNIRVIQLYLESIKEPDRFFESTRQLRTEWGKPVVLLRGGTTDMGRHSARAHTGSAGQDSRLTDDFLMSQGIVLCGDIEEFFDVAKGFSYQPVPRGNRVGVVTMSGANGTLASDAASEFGLSFPSYSDATLKKLRSFLPVDQTLGNPADIGFAMTTGKNVRLSSMQAVLDDPSVDSLLMIDLAVQNSDYPEVRSTYEELKPNGKPIFVVFQGGKTKSKWLDQLEGLRIPVYPTPRRALRVIKSMCEFGRDLKNL